MFLKKSELVTIINSATVFWAESNCAYQSCGLISCIYFCCFSLKGHLDNTSVLSELCATLSRLAVRNEFCQDICDLGGLKLIMTLLADSYESPVDNKYNCAKIKLQSV